MVGPPPLDEDVGDAGERRFCMGPPPPETETLWPKGSSFSAGSDSRRTRDDSWRGAFLRWGSCLWRTAMRSMPGVVE